MELVEHPQLTKALAPPPATMSLVAKFMELHWAMLGAHLTLQPSEREEDTRAWRWPLNLDGQRFTTWGAEDQRVLLAGNPLVAALTTGGLLVCLCLALIAAGRAHRGLDARDAASERLLRDQFMRWAMAFALAYALHYVPFLVMPRMVYVHHYFLASPMGGLAAVATFDHLAGRVCSTSQSRSVAYSSLVAALGASFVYFSPLVYGMTGPRESFLHLRQHASWPL